MLVKSNEDNELKNALQNIAKDNKNSTISIDSNKDEGYKNHYNITSMN